MFTNVDLSYHDGVHKYVLTTGFISAEQSFVSVDVPGRVPSKLRLQGSFLGLVCLGLFPIGLDA
jgi:hypothetical protein